MVTAIFIPSRIPIGNSQLSHEWACREETSNTRLNGMDNHTCQGLHFCYWIASSIFVNFIEDTFLIYRIFPSKLIPTTVVYLSAQQPFTFTELAMPEIRSRMMEEIVSSHLRFSLPNSSSQASARKVGSELLNIPVSLKIAMFAFSVGNIILPEKVST